MRIGKQLEVLEIKGAGSTLYPVLVWDEDALVLIDAGFPGQLNLFEEAIISAGFKIADITHVLLTHQDLDHIGIMRDLLLLAPNAKVLSHREEAASIRGDEAPTKTVAIFSKREQTPENQEQLNERIANYQNYTCRVDHELEDGEIIPICGGIEVIHTPGHTNGHICFYIQRDKAVVTGDTISVREGELVGPTDIHTADMEKAQASNKKVAKVDASVLVGYHGGVYRGDIAKAMLAL